MRGRVEADHGAVPFVGEQPRDLTLPTSEIQHRCTGLDVLEDHRQNQLGVLGIRALGEVVLPPPGVRIPGVGHRCRAGSSLAGIRGTCLALDPVQPVVHCRCDDVGQPGQLDDLLVVSRTEFRDAAEVLDQPFTDGSARAPRRHRAQRPSSVCRVVDGGMRWRSGATRRGCAGA